MKGSVTIVMPGTGITGKEEIRTGSVISSGRNMT